MYFTQSDDGSWYKVDHPWSLYGRVASGDGDTVTQTVAAQSYAVTSQMPPGWGNKTDRSSFYNTPLIVSASVILGILIVFGIIIITYQRRKEARRKKRHAARMRRKALAAAGLTEDGLKDASSVLEAEFKLRLDQLELAHAAKRREKRAQKNRPSTFVRTKVRVWRSTMRRRKSPRTSHDDEDHRVKEHWPPNRHDNRSPRRPDSPGSLLTRDSASFMTDSSRAVSPRRSLSRAGLAGTEQGTCSETLADTAYSVTGSGGISGDASGGEALSPSTSVQEDLGASSASLPSPSVGPGPGGHMPPAYRPASVRSLGVDQAGPSSSRALVPTTHNVLSPEKASVAGFYPAPATADAEQAQEVARRADAKAPIVIPPEEEERRAMHVATDDKRELERMRLGASAPPVTRVENEDGAGPSAPNFEVDGEGFEMLTATEDEADTRSDVAASGTTFKSISSSSRLTVPGLPAPPRSAALRSLRTFTDDDDSLRASSPPSPNGQPPSTCSLLAHLHPSAPLSAAACSQGSSPAPSAPPLESSAPPLEPSAPPLESSAPPLESSAPPLESSAPPLEPSAPPLEPSAPPLSSSVQAMAFESPASGSTPSAPPLKDLDEPTTEDESIHSAPVSSENCSRTDAEDEEMDSVPTPEAEADMDDMSASLSVRGHGFLPRYEP
ncbi:hypothetical protein CspeluHIS016_0301370 [Cutaneotrichosporon spelunceum]|uniref:Uncharacterized protein n=1 Tax=Cutaneotrichosporon spelunceum TaxID=1672016 RepID=A0AAD3TSY7_9TREE|nr:hypothetical protein CspeluHIS016_0301370 [Cutaneotrichosporon spelunceum]